MTAQVDGGVALSPAEEAGGGGEDAPNPANDRQEPATVPADAASGDPWLALANAGAQIAAALAGRRGASAALSAASGARHVTVPLPGPETVQQLANAFATIADSLRKAAEA